MRRPGRSPEGGQATLEAVALIPVLLMVGLAAMQLLAVGYASVLAGGAAEAGALALASGRDAQTVAREALPGWARSRARIGVRGGEVEVKLRPPGLLRALEDELELSATAAVEAP